MLVQSKSDYDIAVGYEFPNSKKLYNYGKRNQI